MTVFFQDSTLLNDASTLSEQCVEGTGIVKVFTTTTNKKNYLRYFESKMFDFKCPFYSTGAAEHSTCQQRRPSEDKHNRRSQN